MPLPNLFAKFAGVKRWLGYDIERPECVSGTDPTVAEQDCQTEEKNRDQPVHVRTWLYVKYLSNANVVLVRLIHVCMN